MSRCFIPSTKLNHGGETGKKLLHFEMFSVMNWLPRHTINNACPTIRKIGHKFDHAIEKGLTIMTYWIAMETKLFLIFCFCNVIILKYHQQIHCNTCVWCVRALKNNFQFCLALFYSTKWKQWKWKFLPAMKVISITEFGATMLMPPNNNRTYRRGFRINSSNS